MQKSLSSGCKIILQWSKWELSPFTPTHLLVFNNNYYSLSPNELWVIIAPAAKGRMGYWLRDHEGKRNDCFSKIQLAGQKSIKTKHLSLVKLDFNPFCQQNITNMAGAFHYQWAI